MSTDAHDITVGSRVIVTTWTGGENEGTVTGVGTTDDGLQMEYTVRVLHDRTEEETFDAEHTELDSDPTLVDYLDAAQLRAELLDIVAGPWTDTTGISAAHPVARLRAAQRIVMIASHLVWQEINGLAIDEIEAHEAAELNGA